MVAAVVGAFVFLVFFPSSNEARPQWRTRPENVKATVGDDVSFNCSFFGLGEGGPFPRWDHLGSIYRMISKGKESYDPHCEITGDFSGGEYNLLIRNVTFEDEGEWKCLQVQAVPQAQKASLTVIEKGEESGSQATASPSYGVVVAEVVTVVVFTLFGVA